MLTTDSLISLTIGSNGEDPVWMTVLNSGGVSALIGLVGGLGGAWIQRWWSRQDKADEVSRQTVQEQERIDRENRALWKTLRQERYVETLTRLSAVMVAISETLASWNGTNDQGAKPFPRALITEAFDSYERIRLLGTDNIAQEVRASIMRLQALSRSIPNDDFSIPGSTYQSGAKGTVQAQLDDELQTVRDLNDKMVQQLEIK